MNRLITRGTWQQFCGAITAQWGQVTGDHLRVIAGRHSQQMGGMDAACGRALDEVRRQLDGVHRRSDAQRARAGQ